MIPVVWLNKGRQTVLDEARSDQRWICSWTLNTRHRLLVVAGSPQIDTVGARPAVRRQQVRRQRRARQGDARACIWS